MGRSRWGFGGLVVSLGIAAGVGCASPQAPPVAAPTTAQRPASEPARSEADTQAAGEARIRAMLAPEATATLSPQRVRLAGGALEVEVLATGPARLERDAGEEVVVFPIGAQSDARCTVFHEEKDSAQLLRVLFENIRREIPLTEVRGIDAGFVGDVPYMDLHAVYVVQREGQTQLGLAKFRTSNIAGRAVLCLHDEPGFRETFARATRPILARPQEAVRPHRYLITLNGQNLGWSTLYDAPGTPARSTTLSAMLLPRTPSELFAMDDAEVSVSAPDGAVTSIEQVSVQNGDISRYQVTREAGRYRVTARHLGRDLRGDFAATPPIISSSRGARLAYAALTARGAPTSFETRGYHHGTPLEASVERWTLERVEDPRRAWVRFRSGDLEVRSLIRADGVSDEDTIRVGGLDIVHRRVTE